MGEVLIHPKRLAEAIDNAVLFSADKAGLAVNHTIMVDWSPERGTLRFLGRGRYSCSVQELAPANPQVQCPGFDVYLDLDDAIDAAKALRATEGAGRKDTTVNLVRLGERSAAVMYGTSRVAVLEDSPEAHEVRSTDDFEGIYEVVERAYAMPVATASPVSPVVLTRGVVKKLDKIKLGAPLHDADRWEFHWIGGASWRVRAAAEGTTVTVMLESCRDGLE